MAERIEAAVKARTIPDFMIIARSDAFWVSHDLEDRLARLALDEHRGAAIVLYYAFSTLVQFEALSSALGAFKTGQVPVGQQALENFLGYR